MLTAVLILTNHHALTDLKSLFRDRVFRGGLEFHTDGWVRSRQLWMGQRDEVQSIITISAVRVCVCQPSPVDVDLDHNRHTRCRKWLRSCWATSSTWLLHLMAIVHTTTANCVAYSRMPPLQHARQRTRYPWGLAGDMGQKSTKRGSSQQRGRDSSLGGD